MVSVDEQFGYFERGLRNSSVSKEKKIEFLLEWVEFKKKPEVRERALEFERNNRHLFHSYMMSYQYD